ncbi:MAG: hypothetical protein Q4E49_06515, partial [Bacteroidales bacterium]|nr:hypothetical protein [Bacteroidales bacterium]
ESEAAQKLPEIIQKFMPNGLLNCEIVNCPIVKFNWFQISNEICCPLYIGCGLRIGVPRHAGCC